MSEYQYYEFLALDQPLSAEAMAEVRALSSRVRPTPSQAVFTYSYGSFRGDPLKLLAKHYDVLLYVANWGSRQLAFRFPKAAIDQSTLQPFYYGVDEIELTTVGQHVILDIAFHPEDGGGDEWLDGEGQLASLAPLRTARGYDEAVAHLAELRDLAVHQGQRAAFDARLQQVVAPYAGSPALQRRLQQKQLVGS